MAEMHFATVQLMIRKLLFYFLYRSSAAQKSWNGWRWTVNSLPAYSKSPQNPPWFFITVS